MRKFLLAAALPLLSTVTYAQKNIGITAGKLFNNYYVNDGALSTNSHPNSFSTGIFYKSNFIKINVSPARFSYTIELLYSDKTTVVNTPRIGPNYPEAQKTIKLNYISSEGSINIVPTRRYIGLTLGLGGYFGVATNKNAELILGGTNNPYSGPLKIDLIDVKDYDFGALLSFDYELKRNLTLTGKATYGLTNLNKSTPPNGLAGHEMLDRTTAHRDEVTGNYLYYRNMGFTIGLKYVLFDWAKCRIKVPAPSKPTPHFHQ